MVTASSIKLFSMNLFSSLFLTDHNMPEICFQKIQYGAYYVHVINRNISDVIPIKSKPLSLRLFRTHD